MKRQLRRAPPRRRSAHASVLRQLGHGVKPGGKTYLRNPKHRNPRPRGGDYSFGVARGG